MNKADHIHLRCPGNIGLIGCVVQIFFPKKPKTAKYAGNWDPKAKQPRSYRFQKWLLSNTFLTKNMQVLVYGNWPDQSKNIRSFFTASYSKSQMTPILEKDFNKILYKFIFVGSLSPGKRPLYSVQLIEQLNKLGLLCVLDIYGEGEERNKLELFIEDHDLIDLVRLHGNQTSETVKEEYKNSDFLILPSRSEGWPKAVAEAMFWGVIPIATRISCVPWMLEHGERGILIDTNLKEDIDKLLELFKKKEQLKKMSLDAQQWSQQYTLDKFEIEIKNLL